MPCTEPLTRRARLGRRRPTSRSCDRKSGDLSRLAVRHRPPASTDRLRSTFTQGQEIGRRSTSSRRPRRRRRRWSGADAALMWGERYRPGRRRTLQFTTTSSRSCKRSQCGPPITTSWHDAGVNSPRRSRTTANNPASGRAVVDYLAGIAARRADDAPGAATAASPSRPAARADSTSSRATRPARRRSSPTRSGRFPLVRRRRRRRRPSPAPPTGREANNRLLCQPVQHIPPLLIPVYVSARPRPRSPGALTLACLRGVTQRRYKSSNGSAMLRLRRRLHDWI